MTQPVRIPADVDREDTVLANLNARQLLIIALSGMLLYGLWSLTRNAVPLPVFLLVALPLGGASALLALGSRDGLSLDRLALAAVRQRMSPRYLITAPEGVEPPPAWLLERASPWQPDDSRSPVSSGVAPAPLRLPAEGVSETGVVDLGSEGVAVVAVCGTVNFVLRTPAEQESLVTAFGRYLHSLTAPVQILVRAERLDLSGRIGELREYAPDLPHPALEAAAREHADYLEQLARDANLLRRQVLLVLREPLRSVRAADSLHGVSPFTGLGLRATDRRSSAGGQALRRSAEARLVRRLAEAAELLGPMGVAVTALDAGQTTAVLAAACDPDSLVPPSSAVAASDEVITSASGTETDPSLRHGGGERGRPAGRGVELYEEP
ncbi:PrgI family protein [Streptomyces sp. NPDC020719]|uniref:PrgI family protein n=1 Tax=Streptomyces sp. NPDC020719 TaxID=3154896 RepID=UPI0033C1AEFC